MQTMSRQISGYTGIKVFTATVARDRETIGDKVTAWLAAQRDVEIVDTETMQSSDASFHCITIVIFHRPLGLAAGAKAA